jgi:hypothetical protein
VTPSTLPRRQGRACLAGERIRAAAQGWRTGQARCRHHARDLSHRARSVRRSAGRDTLRAAVLVGFSTFGVSPLQRTELADRAHACRCARRGGRSASVRSGWCHSPTGRSRRSAMRRVGAAMDHLVDCPAPVRAESRFADGGLVTAATVLAPGQKLRVIKFGGSTPRDTSPGIRRVPASKATPPRASASRSPCGQCGHIDVARMSSRSPRYSPPQPTRPGQ